MIEGLTRTISPAVPSDAEVAELLSDDVIDVGAAALFANWIANEYCSWEQLPDKETWRARVRAALIALTPTLASEVVRLEAENERVGREAFRDGLEAAARLVRRMMGGQFGENAQLVIDVDEGVQADKATLAYVLDALKRRADRAAQRATALGDTQSEEG